MRESRGNSTWSSFICIPGSWTFSGRRCESVGPFVSIISANTHSTEDKRHRLPKDFRFAPVRDILEQSGVLTRGKTR